MFIRVNGNYAREELGRVLSWVWSAMPEDIATVDALELRFTAYDHDERETYVAHIEGRPPGIVLTTEMGQSIDDDVIAIKWIYPGVPGWGAQEG